MKFSIICASFLLIVFSSYTQTNLVPNPSFENHDGTFNNCGGTNGTVDVLNWNRNTNGTPDYHHENYNIGINLCDLVPWTNSGVGACSAPFPTGNQCGGWDGSTGFAGSQACMGIFFNKTTSDRELAYAQLTSPMDITKTYDISFAVRTTGNPTFSLAHCISHFGIAMTTFVPNSFDFNTVTNAQWFPPGGALDWVYIASEMDDEDWTEYSWTYSPAFANQYILIGPMADWPTVTWVDHDGSGGLGGYYHVDDVVIQEVAPLADDEINLVAEVISKDKIEVNWSPNFISTESTYELYRSSDGGISFKKIDVLRGYEAGEFLTYDQNPGTEEVYYKVKEIKENGDRKITDPIRVNNHLNSGGIQWEVKALTEGRLLIDFVSKDAGPGLFSIYDMNGRRLLYQNINLMEGSNILEFDMSRFSKGVYICSLNGASQEKVIVQ